MSEDAIRDALEIAKRVAYKRFGPLDFEMESEVGMAVFKATHSCLPHSAMALAFRASYLAVKRLRRLKARRKARQLRRVWNWVLTADCRSVAR